MCNSYSFTERNVGFVNVGSDHDTSAFAAASIRAWWAQIGRAAYAGAPYIQIMADSGGSNGYNRRLWKWELQALADETGLPIKVSHFPPGTSKWNKVEHRLFSCISQNWRGEPLTSYLPSLQKRKHIQMNRTWFTDADVVKAINTFCEAYPQLETARSDPKAFTRIAATLPIPQGVSLDAVCRMFAIGRQQGLNR